VVLSIDRGDDVGGEHDALAGLSVEAAFPDLDPLVL
jgi:hypothetical protein